MKKILLSTTTLAGLFAGIAFAEESKFDIKLHGAVGFEYGHRHQNKPYTSPYTVTNIDKTTTVKQQDLSSNHKNNLFIVNSRASVEARAKADAGFDYGAATGITTNAKARTGKDSATTDNTYLFLESTFGRFELGSNVSASKTMNLSGSAGAAGTGGATGNWDNFTTMNYGTADGKDSKTFDDTKDGVADFSKTNPSFYTSTGLIGDTYRAANSGEKHNKITYYSPIIAGFQFGVSYTPDSDHQGDGSSFSSKDWDIRTVRNLFSTGLKYSGNVDKLSYSLATIGNFGSINKKYDQSTTAHDLRGYNFGGIASYNGFSLSGSWGTVGKKFFTTDDVAITKAENAANAEDLKFWSSCLGYKLSEFSVSVNYYGSKNYNKNKFYSWGIATDYKLAPGMTTYAEFVDFKATPDYGYTGVSVANKGQVYLLGTTFLF